MEPKAIHSFLPWRTAIVAAATAVIAFSPEWTAALTCTRENWLRIWPLLSGHLCHWTAGHLFWDLLAFGVVGALAERRLGPWFFPVLAVTGSVIIGAVFILMPSIESYRGLSGIDTFLFTFFLLSRIHETPRRTPLHHRALRVVPLALLAGKIVFEAATQSTVFADDLGPGVIPLPIAHAIGGLLGLALGGLALRRDPGYCPGPVRSVGNASIPWDGTRPIQPKNDMSDF